MTDVQRGCARGVTADRVNEIERLIELRRQNSISREQFTELKRGIIEELEARGVTAVELARSLLTEWDEEEPKSDLRGKVFVRLNENTGKYHAIAVLDDTALDMVPFYCEVARKGWAGE